MASDFLYNFISNHKFAVLSTVSDEHKPKSAVVGIAVTKDLKIFFDTVSTSRKYQKKKKNPSVSFVIGWDNTQTIQYEGIARIPDESELGELLEIYFNIFPDGRERYETWNDIAYFIVDPKWIRYSDFSIPQTIEEITL